MQSVVITNLFTVNIELAVHLEKCSSPDKTDDIFLMHMGPLHVSLDCYNTHCKNSGGFSGTGSRLKPPL